MHLRISILLELLLLNSKPIIIIAITVLNLKNNCLYMIYCIIVTVEVKLISIKNI